MHTLCRVLTLCLLFAVALVVPIARANTLRLVMDGDPVSMDPHEQLSGGILQYSHIVFDPLCRWTQERTFEPRLATKWETLDDRTTRFYLRKGVKFHSGNPFTATDVQWTIDRLKRSEDFRGIFEPVEGVKIVDDYTIDIITKQPYPLLLNIATYIFPMDHVFYTGEDENGQPKDAIVKYGNPSFARNHASGTGPFTVAFRVPGVQMVFQRFEEYWDTESPGNVEKIVLTPISDDKTRVDALLTDNADLILPVPPQEYVRIQGDPHVKLLTMSGSRIITLQLNQRRRPEFRDVLVRHAIVHAINNEAIVKEIMHNAATAAGQHAPKGLVGYMNMLAPRYNLKRAQGLMKKAGYADGFECTMVAPNNRYINDEKIAEAVVSMLAQIKIKVNLTTMSKAVYWEQFDAQQADIQMIGWHPDTEDSGNYSEFLLMCPNKETGYGHYNSGNYCNPIVDDLVLRSQSETDVAIRNEMLQQVERIIYDDAAFVPLHWPDVSWASRENVLIEPIVNPANFPYFGDLVIE